MKHSEDRILTTHVGSLPRPDDLVEMIVKKLHGEPIDENALKARVRDAVSDIVKRQTDIGIDIVSDGEMSKPGFSNYIINRYSGFGGSPVSGTPSDLAEFPNVRERIWSATHEDARRVIDWTPKRVPVVFKNYFSEFSTDQRTSAFLVV